MREDVLSEIEIIKKHNEGFTTPKWKRFRFGGMHISEVEIKGVPDYLLLLLYTELIKWNCRTRVEIDPNYTKTQEDRREHITRFINNEIQQGIDEYINASENSYDLEMTRFMFLEVLCQRNENPGKDVNELIDQAIDALKNEGYNFNKDNDVIDKYNKD